MNSQPGNLITGLIITVTLLIVMSPAVLAVDDVAVFHIGEKEVVTIEDLKKDEADKERIKEQDIKNNSHDIHDDEDDSWDEEEDMGC